MKCFQTSRYRDALSFILLTFVSSFVRMFDAASGKYQDLPGPWGAWTACSVTCGLGTMTRRRLCPSGSSTWCIHADSRSCAEETCLFVNVEDSVTAFEGSQIILNCPRGVGRGEQLYWIGPYGERIGPETISVQYEARDNTLLFHDVDPVSAGTYHCVAKQADGSTITGDAKLVVLTCSDADPCHNGGKCVEVPRYPTVGGRVQPRFRCVCRRGFSGTLCELVRLSNNAILISVLILAMVTSMILSFCCCLCWQHRKSRGVGHNDVVVEYHALPDDDFTQRPSYDRLGHHGYVEASAHDEIVLQPSIGVVSPVRTNGTVIPAMQDFNALQPDSRPIAVPHQFDVMGHISPTDGVRHQNEETEMLIDVESSASTSSRQSEAYGDFPLTWKAINAMRGVRPEVIEERRSRRKQRRTSDMMVRDVASPKSGHVTRRSSAVSRKGSMESGMMAYSLPTHSVRKTSSRASSSSAAASSSRKLRKSRGERTHAREQSLDRIATRTGGGARSWNRDGDGGVRAPTSYRTSRSPVKVSPSSFQTRPLPKEEEDHDKTVILSRLGGKPPMNPTGDSHFYKLVQLSTPITPRLASPRRDLHDEKILRELRSSSSRRSKSGSPAYPRASGAIGGSASTTSWHSTPSPVVARAGEHSYSMPPVHTSHEDEVFSSRIDKSTPRNASAAHFDHPSVLSELSKSTASSGFAAIGVGLDGNHRGVVPAGETSTMSARWPIPPLVSRDSRVPVSKSLASRSVLVDSSTGVVLAPPHPPPPSHTESRHLMTTDLMHQDVAKPPMAVLATVNVPTSTANATLDRAKSRLKFVVAVPKTTLQSLTPQHLNDPRHSSNIDSPATIPPASSAESNQRPHQTTRVMSVADPVSGTHREAAHRTQYYDRSQHTDGIHTTIVDQHEPRTAMVHPSGTIRTAASRTDMAMKSAVAQEPLEPSRRRNTDPDQSSDRSLSGNIGLPKNNSTSQMANVPPGGHNSNQLNVPHGGHMTNAPPGSHNSNPPSTVSTQLQPGFDHGRDSEGKYKRPSRETISHVPAAVPGRNQPVSSSNAPRTEHADIFEWRELTGNRQKEPTNAQPWSTHHSRHGQNGGARKPRDTNGSRSQHPPNDSSPTETAAMADGNMLVPSDHVTPSAARQRAPENRQGVENGRGGRVSNDDIDWSSRAAAEDTTPLKPSFSEMRSTRHAVDSPIHQLYSPPTRGPSSQNQSFRPLVTQSELDLQLDKMKTKNQSKNPMKGNRKKASRETPNDVRHGEATVADLRSVFEQAGRSSEAIGIRRLNEEFHQRSPERAPRWQTAGPDSDGWDTVLDEDVDDDEGLYRFHRTPVMSSSLRSPDGHRRKFPTARRTPPGGWSSSSPRRWHVNTSPPQPHFASESGTSSLEARRKSMRGGQRYSRVSRQSYRSPTIANICFQFHNNGEDDGRRSISRGDDDGYTGSRISQTKPKSTRLMDDDDWRYVFT